MQTLIGSPEQVLEAARWIRAGELVAFPTETVYGLGANAWDASACQKIFQAKGRPADNPLIVHVSGLDGLEGVVSASMSEPVRRLLSVFWPGPLTVVLPADQKIPAVVRGGLPTVAVRAPNHPVAQALIAACGCPIAAPSANISGRPSPTVASDVFEDLKGRIPLILDGGLTHWGLESTVVDVTTTPAVVLRPGAISIDQLETYLGTVMRAATDTPVKAPGMKYRHYAPTVPVWWWKTEDPRHIDRLWSGLDDRESYAVLASDAIGDAIHPSLFYNLGDTDQDVAQRLFHGLRHLDRKRPRAIIVSWVPKTPLGEAIANRLGKASGQEDVGRA